MSNAVLLIFAATEFAFHLDVCSLLQSGRKLGELAEGSQRCHSVRGMREPEPKGAGKAKQKRRRPPGAGIGPKLCSGLHDRKEEAHVSDCLSEADKSERTKATVCSAGNDEAR